MVLNLNSDEVGLIVTALRCSAHVSRDAGHDQQADTFSNLAQRMDDERWAYIEKEEQKEKRDTL